MKEWELKQAMALLAIAAEALKAAADVPGLATLAQERFTMLSAKVLMERELLASVRGVPAGGGICGRQA